MPTTYVSGKGNFYQPDLNFDIWIPDQNTPCGQFPDLWSDADTWKYNPKLRDFAKIQCKTRCPLANECLLAALQEERGKPAHARLGIRGGFTPIERFRMATYKKSRGIYL